jgi:hypothetical protein
MMKVNEVTTFKIPPDKTEADNTMRKLIDEGFEKDKLHPDNAFLFWMPRAEANMCCTEAQSTHLWLLRSVLQTWTNQRCRCKIC